MSEILEKVEKVTIEDIQKIALKVSGAVLKKKKKNLDVKRYCNLNLVLRYTENRRQLSTLPSLHRLRDFCNQKWLKLLRNCRR